jgi:23S rRNA (uridine2552-2'-O)-methyltransferase
MTNNKKTYSKNRKKENFYKEAKKVNVRARSYFKLEQIDRKFNLIRENMKILDLGSAPGAWLEYIDKKIEKGNVIGIDLLELKNLKEFSENIRVIQDDFNEISYYLEEDEQFDLILSDMAPEFSGDSVFDRGRTHKLNFKTIDFAKKHLKNGGNLLFKSFEGEDLPKVRKYAKEIFKEIKEFKPKSSQKKSSEVFEICINKK